MRLDCWVCTVFSPRKLCWKSKIIDSERLKCTNGMENFFYVICVEALGSCSVACHNLKSLGKRNFYCVCSKKCTKALNFEDRTVSTLRIKWLFWMKTKKMDSVMYDPSPWWHLWVQRLPGTDVRCWVLSDVAMAATHDGYWRKIRRRKYRVAILRMRIHCN